MSKFKIISKMFESKIQLFVFVFYIAVWVLYGQLITWSKSEEFIPYSAVLTVLFAELGKCIICLVAYRWQSGNSFTQLLALINKERKLWVLYLIPSSLYAIYNILAFYSLELTDPTTYFIFLQMR